MIRTSNKHVTVRALVKLTTFNDATLIKVTGFINEHFKGFDTVTTKTAVIDLSGLTGITSFGVHLWIRGVEQLTKSVSDLYLYHCPTFIIDQLNMVFNFGGPAKVLTISAPYVCTGCQAELTETVDVLANYALLARAGLPERTCTTCSAMLQLDESPVSYLQFVPKYGAKSISAAAAQLLAVLGLYRAPDPPERAPRIVKVVEQHVAFYRIIGSIGAMFRARPLLAGNEDEVVIDLAEVDSFRESALKEWNRLITTLATQASSVTLLDVTESFLATAGDDLTGAPNVHIGSALVAFACPGCGNAFTKSIIGPPPPTYSCSSCGEAAPITPSPRVFEALAEDVVLPPATIDVIDKRDELVARANAEESAQSTASGIGSGSTDESILGKYKVVRRLSSDHAVELFLAKQVGIGGFEKPVTLQRIPRAAAVDVVLEQAKLAGRLIHPNIAQLLDVGEHDGAVYLATEYVQGRYLGELLKQQSQLPLGVVCFIGSEVAQALHHAHASTDVTTQQPLGVIHHELMPHNVLCSFDGAVKLLELGMSTTSLEQPADKLAFTAPEVLQEKPADHRSNLYSLGVLLYVATMGSLPFAGRDPRDLLRRIRNRQFKRPPAELEALLTQLLSPYPEERPATAEDVVTELTEIARHAVVDCSANHLARVLTEHFPNSHEPAQRNSRLSLPPPDRPGPGPGPIAAVAPTKPEEPVAPAPAMPVRRTLSWARIVVALILVLAAAATAFVLVVGPEEIWTALGWRP